MADKKSYDPTHTYKWEKDTKFELSGEEFGMVINSLKAIAATNEAIMYQQIYQALQKVEAALSKAIEEGKVEDITFQNQQQKPNE
jgi:hypothetical protein